MNLTPDMQKKTAAVVGFVALAGGILWFELFRDGGPPAAPAAPVVVTVPAGPVVKTVGPGSPMAAAGVAAGPAAKSLGTAASQLDPTLRMEAMLVTESLVYSGGGRNIFSSSSVPVNIPKPVAPVRMAGGKTPQPVFVPPPQPAGPPPPPPIDLKFFGVATTPEGKRRAFLLHGEDVVVAMDGEIVQRRYKVITVSANSIVVEDMAYNNRQTLPLLAR